MITIWPDTDKDIRNSFLDISRIQTLGKSCKWMHLFSLLGHDSSSVYQWCNLSTVVYSLAYWLDMLSRGGSSRRAAGLHPSLKNVRQKISPNGQTRPKSGFSYEISQHNHFRYFRHHFCSTFPRNPTKPVFRSFPTTTLMRSRFQHTCRWICRFRGCLRHSPKGKKPNNRLQETWWYVRLSQIVFMILTMNF